MEFEENIYYEKANLEAKYQEGYITTEEFNEEMAEIESQEEYYYSYDEW
jgi:hypothetical protein